ncbi:MAG: KEOPS complex kinase/ATPase Bud32 [Candidatus Jordarchaeum sp.]|uniref:KEOPS complex kinase/ATPase Bud32 n=1 Tax=Candidatus Jordarchaeum sp. TaxID=2823881 RepID=UPI00404AE95D
MLYRKGAEAYLYLEEWYDRKVIIKRRVSKAYRVQELDEKLRKERTVKEAKLLSDARKAGVPTPMIYFIDMDNTTIIMDFIQGPQVKTAIQTMKEQEKKSIFRNIGSLIGRLHNAGIIHGDLTTSNMILQDSNIYFVDFGLGDYSVAVEDQGVDLHLMNRALQSTHYAYAEKGFKVVLEGYQKTMYKSDEVVERMYAIEKRGRYHKER